MSETERCGEKYNPFDFVAYVCGEWPRAVCTRPKGHDSLHHDPARSLQWGKASPPPPAPPEWIPKLSREIL